MTSSDPTDDRLDGAAVDEITEVPDTMQGGSATSEGSTWPIGTDLAGYLAEAAVADYFLQQDAGTVWRGGNHRGVDIYAGFPAAVSDKGRFTAVGQRQATVRVDVKHSYENDYLLDGRRQRVVSFFGSNRTVQVREGVSHYALVVFELEPDKVRGNHVEVSDTLDVRVSATYRVRRLYLVPAADVNLIFRPKENRAGAPTGLEQCATLEEIEQFLVAGTALTD